MIFRSLFLLCVLLAARQGFSQQQAVDSLRQRLLQQTNPDTFRLNTLIALAGDYYSVDPSQGILIADSAIALANTLRLPQKLASAYINKGNNYWALGQDSLAEEMFQSGLIQHREAGNQMGIGRVYNNLGLLRFNAGDYIKALEYNREAMKIFRAADHKIAMANSFTNTGVVHQYMADYPMALENYLQALRIFDESGDSLSTGRGNILTNLGLVYKNTRQYDKSLHYASMAAELYRRIGHKQGLANVLGNIGTLYDEQDQSEKAISWFEEALRINETLGNKRRIGSDLTNIGTAWFNLGQYDKAFEFLEKALQQYNAIDDKNSMSIVLNLLGRTSVKAPAATLRKYGIDPEKRYTVALAHQQRGLKLAMDIGAADRQSELYAGLSETYEARGDHRNAFIAYRAFSNLQDSIFNNEKNRELQRKEMQYEYERLEALNKAELERQELQSASALRIERLYRNIALGGGILLLIAALIFINLYKNKRDAQQQKTIAEFNTLVAETEMQALRSQVNPHFIFNSLNSIADYIDKRDTATAGGFIGKFARLMRMTLEHSGKKTISLAEELHTLELYMQLEALRVPNTFTYAIRVDPALDPETIYVPPMILQPFVENSIWHGLRAKNSPGHIDIDVTRKNNMLICSVTDNGVGRKGKVKSSTEHSSFGLHITQARIDILNKLRHANARMILTDLDEGVRAEVCLPLDSDIALEHTAYDQHADN